MTEHRHAEDELQVPPPRADKTRDDPDVTDDAADRDFQAAGADTRDERAEQRWQGQEREEMIQDDRAREGQGWEDRPEDDRMAQERATEEGMAGEGLRQPMTDADPETQQGDARYRDPYETRTPDDVLAAAPGDTGTRETEASSRERMEASRPGGMEARPERGGFMLDQDPEQVRIRWREVQVAFVDEPRQSVERADTLVDELLSTLTSQADQLRDRWKNSSEGDTEQLRQALREYRSMLDRLLTLTSAER